MTTWKTLRLDRQTATPLTVTTDWKENKKRRSILRRFFVFCQHTVSTSRKSHMPTAQSQNLREELTLAPTQRIKFETLLQTGLCS